MICCEDTWFLTIITALEWFLLHDFLAPILFHTRIISAVVPIRWPDSALQLDSWKDQTSCRNGIHNCDEPLEELPSSDELDWNFWDHHETFCPEESAPPSWNAADLVVLAANIDKNIYILKFRVFISNEVKTGGIRYEIQCSLDSHFFFPCSCGWMISAHIFCLWLITLLLCKLTNGQTYVFVATNVTN